MARTNLTPVGLRHLLRHRHMEEPAAMSVDEPLEAISPGVWRISQMIYQDLRVIVQGFVELTDWCPDLPRVDQGTPGATTQRRLQFNSGGLI